MFWCCKNCWHCIIVGVVRALSVDGFDSVLGVVDVIGVVDVVGVDLKNPV